MFGLYFAYFVLFYGFVYCFCFCIYSRLFSTSVQVYRPQVYPIAVNKYHIITTSQCSRQENILKYKVVTLHAMKAYRKGRGIAPLIPNLGTSFTTRPVHPPVKNPKQAGWVPEQVSTCRRRRQTFLLTIGYNCGWADASDVSVWRCNDNYISVLVRIFRF